MLLAEQGRFSEAIAEARRAQHVAPESAAVRANVATVLFFTGRREQAIEEARQALALDAESARAHLILGLALEQAGMRDEAVAALEKARRSGGRRYPGVIGALAHAYAAAGRPADLHALLKRLGRTPSARGWGYVRALAAVGADRLDDALRCLEQAHQDREFQMVLLKVDRRLDKLRGNPRFGVLLRQTGLG